MDSLTLSSYLGPNLDPAALHLAKVLSTELLTEVHFDASVPTEERITKIVAGEIDIMWMCGLLTVEMLDRRNLEAQVVAAPVFAGQTQPVYHSVIVVAADSPFSVMADLAGARLVVNQFGSWSGNHALRRHVKDLGLADLRLGDRIGLTFDLGGGGHVRAGRLRRHRSHRVGLSRCRPRRSASG